MQYYLDHFEVLYVMLVGSRSFGIVTEDSDFDIAIFVKEINNSTEHKYGQWLTYHHRLVHNNLVFDTMHPIQHISGSWFLDTIDTIESPTHIFLVWAMAWYSHNSDLIWVNPEYEVIYDYLKKSKDFLLKYALHQEVKSMHSLLQHWYKDSNITYNSQVYWKPLYRYLVAWEWVENTGTLSTERYQFIEMVKNISKFISSDNKIAYAYAEPHIKTAVNMLQKCIDFYSLSELPTEEYELWKEKYKKLLS